MAATKTEIFNLALAHLGVKPVTSDSETSVQALALTRVWDSSRRETLAGHDWGFATVEGLLTEVANYTPPPGWSYGYGMPSRALRIWRIYNATAAGVFIDPNTGRPVYDEGLFRANSINNYRRIFDPTLSLQIFLSNVPDAYASYTYDMEDVSQFDPDFVVALGLRLAANSAVALTGDPEKAKNLIMLSNAKISESERMSSYETDKQGGDDLIIDSRG